jgi:hypothetical protein
VVDEKGEPVACKVLASKRTDLGYDNLHYAGLSPGEEFEFTGLETGVYSIAATTSDGKIGWLEDIDASEGGSRRDLMVRVVQGGRLRVSYEGSKDRGGVDVIVNGMPVSGGLVERGRPTIFTAPVGKVLVRVDTWGPDPIRERTVDVDVGVTTDVVIDYGAH